MPANVGALLRTRSQKPGVLQNSAPWRRAAILRVVCLLRKRLRTFSGSETLSCSRRVEADKIKLLTLIGTREYGEFCSGHASWLILPKWAG